MPVTRQKDNTALSLPAATTSSTTPTAPATTTTTTTLIRLPPFFPPFRYCNLIDSFIGCLFGRSSSFLTFFRQFNRIRMGSL